MSKGKFAVGALIGAVAGVIAGVLTAPKSGKDTRADIKTKATELKNDTKQHIDDAKEKSDHIASDVKNKLNEVKNDFSAKKQK